MPFKCSVPHCKGNYANGAKVSVFAFPNDEKEKNVWLRAICRDNFVPVKNSKVCELHFKTSDIERETSMYDERSGRLLTAPLSHPRLRTGAVPSILLGCPKYLSKPAVSVRESPDEKRQRIEMEMIEKSIAESLSSHEVYNSKVSFASLKELKLLLQDYKFNSGWTLVLKDSSVNFVLIRDLPSPQICCSIKINEQLRVEIYYRNVSISKVDKKPLPDKIKNINEIDSFLDYFYNLFCNHENESLDNNSAIDLILSGLNNIKSTIENEIMLNFLKKQVTLLDVPKNRARYSADYLIFCAILQSISSHAYNFLRSSGYVKLPCLSTIKSLCSKFNTSPSEEQCPSGLLKYVLSKFNLLSPSDKTVVLLMDEIHLKSSLDYKGGGVVGTCVEGEQNATTACVFMITSMLSNYKDVVHILPVTKLTGNLLHRIVKEIVVGLEGIGFEVLAVICDNNAVNRKAMSLFSESPSFLTSYVHPKDPDRKLYFLFDTVHLLKSVRNNWLNQKPQQEIQFTDKEDKSFVQTASFSALKEMHAFENNSIFKYGYTLNLKSLYPSSMEKQNVKLALNVFNTTIVTALTELGPVQNFSHWESTASFIQYICTWWDIVNVKTPWKGRRLRNDFQKPVTHSNCMQLQYLQAFFKWLNEWDSTCPENKLTSQTHSALSHTTKGLIELSQYLLTEKKYSYVLLGKLQTDNLESRFGKYRQLSGGNYHVSVRQIFESETKLRIQSVLPMVIKSKTLGDINLTSSDVDNVLEHFIVKTDEPIVLPPSMVSLPLNEDDIDCIPDTMWPIITYIAGYCSYAVTKKVKCGYCTVFVTSAEDGAGNACSLISSSDRGGLKYPSDGLVTCIAYLYILFNKIVPDLEDEFLHLQNQKKVFMQLGIAKIPDDVLYGFNCQTHKIETIINYVLSAASNIMLNNYVKRKNDVFVKNNMPTKKRQGKNVNRN